MGDRIWDFTGGADGVDITTANGGTGLTTVTKDAGNTIKFETDNPYYGPSTARITALAASATGSFVTLVPDVVDPIFTFSFPFILESDLTGATSNTFVAARLASSTLWSIREVWVGGLAQLQLWRGGTTSAIGQIGSGSLVEGNSTWYRVEGTVNGTTGAYSVRLRDGATDNQIGTTLSGTDAALVGTIVGARVGSVGSVNQALAMRLGYTVLRTGSSTPIDPPDAEPVPLSTPVVTITGATDPSAFGAEDGSITATWPAVANANHYEAGIAAGLNQTEGFDIVSTSATSPFTWDDLSGGDYTVAIRAIPA